VGISMIVCLTRVGCFWQTYHSYGAWHNWPEDVDKRGYFVAAHPADMQKMERMEASSPTLSIFVYLAREPGGMPCVVVSWQGLRVMLFC